VPKLRPAYITGHYYHFYNRGRSRLPIFREPENYLFVIKKNKYYAGELKLKPIAYCLLPNHFHLLIRQDGELSAGLLPQRVFNSYSKAFNHKYGHSGTLFEGNYRVILLDEPSHLLHLCRYIHSNPVKHGIVSDPTDWPYSNYLEWIGERHGSLYDPDFVSENFHNSKLYRLFVMDFITGKEMMPDGLMRQLAGVD
jgi:putative transposase